MLLNGTARALQAFDIGRSLDLELASNTLTSSQRVRLQHKQHVVGGQVRSSLPLRMEQEVAALELGPRVSTAQVEITLYGFGALGITWSLPFDGSIEDLVAISSLLYENPALIANSREIARGVVRSLGSAVDRPRVHDDPETYVIFETGPLPGGPDALLAEARHELARVLRAEEGPLSEQEIVGALAGRVSYGAADACLVDWLGAFLTGADTRDERFVLELATVELLQLRRLDAQLDGEIQEAYGVLMRPHRPFASLGLRGRELERVARMQTDDALLHEGIDNALKIFGDDYLARLYRTAGERFHFDEWDASIERKLGVLQNVYERLADLAAHRRSEALEWIIITLIAVEILLSFMGLG